ncbi:hypothetical protein [Rubrobacter aplysinae]|uniref:hypothetical protein n=1 Tax=Rubrobacter aplysinae TaxID=909625 RepID=UPI00064BAC87|nr:hypothetical protein [Rubrobacter aplysinae]
MAEQGDRPSIESLGSQGSCWVICSGDLPDGPRDGLLTVDLWEWGKTLPIFGSEEAALGFLREDPVDVSRNLPGAPGALWLARARLVSLLLDGLSDVDRVVFNPPSGSGLRYGPELASICTGEFVDLVLGRGRA